MNASIYTYVLASMHICGHTCIYASIYACMLAYMTIYVSIHACMPAYMHIWRHICMYARIHAYVLAYMHISTHDLGSVLHDLGSFRKSCPGILVGVFYSHWQMGTHHWNVHRVCRRHVGWRGDVWCLDSIRFAIPHQPTGWSNKNSLPQKTSNK